MAPKKAKTVFLAAKFMAAVFWDNREVIVINYYQNIKIITGAYDASLFEEEVLQITGGSTKNSAYTKKNPIKH